MTSLSFERGSRTAVILDSAIEVALVSETLRNQTDLEICEVSGFRRDPIDEPFDILVGNKAVEVGIDFKGDTAIQRPGLFREYGERVSGNGLAG